jgi:hypothetical protein
VLTGLGLCLLVAVTIGQMAYFLVTDRSRIARTGHLYRDPTFLGSIMFGAHAPGSSPGM